METQGVGVKPHRTQQVPASTSIHSWYWKGHRSYFSCISCCRGLSELAVSLDRYNLQLVPYQCTKNAKMFNSQLMLHLKSLVSEPSASFQVVSKMELVLSWRTFPLMLQPEPSEAALTLPRGQRKAVSHVHVCALVRPGHRCFL